MHANSPGITVDGREPGVAVVALSGELETFHAPKLDRELSGMLAHEQSIVVDLTGADFIDSSIVTVLLRARDDAREQGLRFALVMDDSTGSAVRRLFEITGLDGVFAIANDADRALAAAA